MSGTRETSELTSISQDISRLKQQDEQAWNSLVAKFQSLLSAKARWMLRDSTLERRLEPSDLVNVCLTKAWQKSHQFRGTTTSEFAAWVLRILHTTFIDECRPKTLDYTASSWVLHVGDSSTPSQRLLAEEEEARLHACLAELDASSREVVVMRNLEGKKFREIADELGTTTATIAGRYRRAIESLSKQMNPPTS